MAVGRVRADLILVCAIAALLAGPAGAGAHDLGVVRVRLDEVGPARYLLDVRVPLVPEFESQFPTLATHCRLAQAPDVRRVPGAIDMRLAFDCGGVPLARTDVLRLPWPNHGAFVSASLGTGSIAGRFVEASEQGVSVVLDTLTEQNNWIGVSRRYLLLGIEHILTGWDHLAFVLTLCLMVTGWPLLRLVSAFTVGHSLTLALAALGVVHVPAAPIEACIALSIVFVAHQAATGVDAKKKKGDRLVFAFGLLHGLGFANALAASGIEHAEFFVGLVTFNLGVEIGQLMFVAIVLSVGLLGRFMEARPRQALTTTAAYAVGILGTFWTLQRTL